MKHDADLPICIPASLVAPMVKNLPAMQEAWVQPLGWGDPLGRQRQPTPGFWPGESHGQRSLVGYRTQGRKELDATVPLRSQARHMYLFDLENCCCYYYRPQLTGVMSPTCVLMC